MIAAFFGVASAVVLTFAGVLALRYAWADATRGRVAVIAGWVMLLLAIPGWTGVADLDKALALATLVPSLVAFAVIAAGIEFRRRGAAPRSARNGAELTAEPGNPLRLISRALLAGPVAAVAAATFGMAVCLRAPMGEANRLVLGGFLIPLAWAAFACWALTDARVARVSAILALVAASGGAGIFL